MANANLMTRTTRTFTDYDDHVCTRCGRKLESWRTGLCKQCLRETDPMNQPQSIPVIGSAVIPDDLPEQAAADLSAVNLPEVGDRVAEFDLLAYAKICLKLEEEIRGKLKPCAVCGESVFWPEAGEALCFVCCEFGSERVRIGTPIGGLREAL